MEDAGMIGQWANNEKLLLEVDDAINKLSLTSHGGASQLMGLSLLSPEVQRHSSASVLNAKSSSVLEQSKEKVNSTLKLPLISGQRRGKIMKRKTSTGKTAATAAKRRSSPSASKKTSSSASKKSSPSASKKSSPSRQLKATGSRTSTPTTGEKRKTGSGKAKKKGATTASRRASRSPTGKRPKRSNSGRRSGSSRATSASLSRRSSRTSPALSRRSSRGNSAGGRSRSSRGRRKDDKKRTKKGKAKRSSHGSSKEVAFATAVASLAAVEMERRVEIIREEEAEHESFLPDYNLLVMNIVRSQLQEVNQRQRCLNDAFKVFQKHGIQLSDSDTSTAFETLRARLQAEMQKQIEDVRVENLSLRSMLEESKAEVEQKNTELQGLRDKINRKLMRFEVESESLKAEVQSVLRTGHLDVDRMKRELGHRLDVATAALRTPKYDTALRSMQELVRSVQEEIQEHHDTMTKLIVYIGAQDTFLRDKSESMHSNFPQRYRDELRKLEKDRLLNVLDVLSFNDSAVETVGKFLYVMQKTEYQTNVF